MVISQTGLKDLRKLALGAAQLPYPLPVKFRSYKDQSLDPRIIHKSLELQEKQKPIVKYSQRFLNLSRVLELNEPKDPSQGLTVYAESLEKSNLHLQALEEELARDKEFYSELAELHKIVSARFKFDQAKLYWFKNLEQKPDLAQQAYWLAQINHSIYEKEVQESKLDPNLIESLQNDAKPIKMEDLETNHNPLNLKGLGPTSTSILEKILRLNQDIELNGIGSNEAAKAIKSRATMLEKIVQGLSKRFPESLADILLAIRMKPKHEDLEEERQVAKAVSIKESLTKLADLDELVSQYIDNNYDDSLSTEYEEARKDLLASLEVEYLPKAFKQVLGELYPLENLNELDPINYLL